MVFQIVNICAQLNCWKCVLYMYDFAISPLFRISPLTISHMLPNIGIFKMSLFAYCISRSVSSSFFYFLFFVPFIFCLRLVYYFLHQTFESYPQSHTFFIAMTLIRNSLYVAFILDVCRLHCWLFMSSSYFTICHFRFSDSFYFIIPYIPLVLCAIFFFSPFAAGGYYCFCAISYKKCFRIKCSHQ